MKILAALLCSFFLGLSFDRWILEPSDLHLKPQKETVRIATNVQQRRTLAREISYKGQTRSQKQTSFSELLDLSLSSQRIPDPLQNLKDRLSENPEDRSALLKMLREENDTDRLEILFSLFQFSTEDNVIRVALDLTANPDREKRKTGFLLLQEAQKENPAIRNQILESLATESDAGVLTAAISSLIPNDGRTQNEKSRVTNELTNFAQHESPEVRGEAILALRRWDKSASTENLVEKALSNPANLETSAALQALIENPFQNQNVKIALLRLAESSNAGQDSRWTALHILDDYPLTPSEESTLSNIRNSLPKSETERD